MDERELYACWLAHIPDLGNKTIKKLAEYAGGEKEIYRLAAKEAEKILSPKKLERFLLWQRKQEPKRLWEELEKRKIRFAPFFSKEYPERLKNIPDAPYALFFRGEPEKMPERLVAVIGARECSSYGSFLAEHIGRKLAQKGTGVVSGLARGIDGITQKAAVLAGGFTAGVLGCGVDVCYPAENRSLYESCAKQGLLVSEYPPGTRPLAWRFPPRNRLISGLSDAVVVVEAREKSGTFITVDMALEQGREIFVVPGRITDPLSRGCNRLIGQGASVFSSVEELLESLDGRMTKKETVLAETEKPLLHDELMSRIYELCDFDPRSFTDFLQSLSGETGKESVSPGKLAENLMELQLLGLVGEKGQGYYYRKK